MNAEKLSDIREAHQRLRDEYRLAMDRSAEAQAAVTLAEANDGEEPSPRTLAARQRLAKQRAQAQALARRLRASTTVFDKLDGYGRLTGSAR